MSNSEWALLSILQLKWRMEVGDKPRGASRVRLLFLALVVVLLLRSLALWLGSLARVMSSWLMMRPRIELFCGERVRDVIRVISSGSSKISGKNHSWWI